MRLLHTSDWHLGHTLHDLLREREHAAFLAWLRQTLHDHEVDALVIAEDVFDAAHPPPPAQRGFDCFTTPRRHLEAFIPRGDCSPGMPESFLDSTTYLTTI